MKVRPEQLANALQRSIAPIFLIHGGEPLQSQEAADQVRVAVRAQGYDERQCLTVDKDFDWSQLAAAAGTFSLFADRRLLELRLGAAKPGVEGGKALAAYAKSPPTDTVLLVLADKLESASLRSRWVGALESAGISVQVWPLNAAKLPAWIENRMRRRGLNPTGGAAQLLANRVEGNLLAAAQEIDKLSLLCGSEPLDEQRLLAAVIDSSRYTVFNLADAALAGQISVCAKTLQGLRSEGTEPILVLWALTREIRQLTALHGDLLQSGGNLAAALARQHIWESRKALLENALRRLPGRTCRSLLRRCAELDRLLKGADGAGLKPAVLWDELLALSLNLSGLSLAGGPKTD